MDEVGVNGVSGWKQLAQTAIYGKIKFVLPDRYAELFVSIKPTHHKKFLCIKLPFVGNARAVLVGL